MPTYPTSCITCQSTIPGAPCFGCGTVASTCTCRDQDPRSFGPNPECPIDGEVPTADNYGSLPVGTHLDGIGTILDRSLTAYLVDLDGPHQGDAWAPFANVHPRRQVEPLVVLR